MPCGIPAVLKRHPPAAFDISRSYRLCWSNSSGARANESPFVPTLSCWSLRFAELARAAAGSRAVRSHTSRVDMQAIPAVWTRITLFYPTVLRDVGDAPVLWIRRVVSSCPTCLLSFGESAYQGRRAHARRVRCRLDTQSAAFAQNRAPLGYNHRVGLSHRREERPAAAVMAKVNFRDYDFLLYEIVRWQTASAHVAFT